MKHKKRKINEQKSIIEKSDRYAQIQLSTDHETKNKIMDHIERLRKRFNKNIKEDEILFSKSDVAIEAMKLGLKELSNRS
jgi:hypothetical protein